MSTSPETESFILDYLHPRNIFSTKRMFGEYALYCNGSVVGFICDDTLYVKILESSHELEAICEQDEAYPGSKLYYVVDESQILQLENLSEILQAIAHEVPPKNPKVLNSQ